MPVANLPFALFAAWRRRPGDPGERRAVAPAFTATARVGAGARQHGMVPVAEEIRTALALAVSRARSRGIELQMAVGPDVIAGADFADYRAWLRYVFENAISRAVSGVLVTAVRRDDSVEIGILDDGADAVRRESTAGPWKAAPLTACVAVAQSRSAGGTTLLLRLPSPLRQQASCAEAPATRVEAPATRAEAPATRAEAPATRAEAPATHAEAPATHAGAPASHPVPADA